MKTCTDQLFPVRGEEETQHAYNLLGKYCAAMIAVDIPYLECT